MAFKNCKIGQNCMQTWRVFAEPVTHVQNNLPNLVILCFVLYKNDKKSKNSNGK